MSNTEKNNSKSLTFFVISDFGVANEFTRKVAKAMSYYAENISQPSFILGLGDNFYPSGVASVDDPLFQRVWRDVFLQYNALHVLWQMVLGNHDYIKHPQAQVDYTFNKDLNRGGYWQMPNRCYEFQHSLPLAMNTIDGEVEEKQLSTMMEEVVEFFMIDTCGVQSEVLVIAPEAEQLLRNNITALDEKLTASKAKWKIVAGHHCMYTQGAYHGAMGRKLRHQQYLENERSISLSEDGFGLEEVLMKHKVQVYLSGHEHVMEYALRNGIHNFMCGASGAERRHGDGLLGGSSIESIVDWLANGDEYGFVAFTFEGDSNEKLIGRFINENCEKIKEFIVPLTNPLGEM